MSRKQNPSSEKNVEELKVSIEIFNDIYSLERPARQGSHCGRGYETVAFE